MTADTSPIVITGGAQRLGLATALALKEDGFDIIITHRQDHASIKELQKQGIRTCKVDFSIEKQTNYFVETLNKEYSSLRAIIHNASEWKPEQTNSDLEHLIEQMLNIHVKIPYLINHKCANLLQTHASSGAYADIIHLSDYVSDKGSKKHVAYAASKAALDNLTLSFAAKYAPQIKVNSIAPSLLMFNESDSEQYREKSLKKSLLGISPGFDEGINAIRFLLKSNYITGRTLALDGGRHIAR